MARLNTLCSNQEIQILRDQKKNTQLKKVKGIISQPSGIENMMLLFKHAIDSITTYGDHPALPKVEDVIGKPLSPYAVTKYVKTSCTPRSLHGTTGSRVSDYVISMYSERGRIQMERMLL